VIGLVIPSSPKFKTTGKLTVFFIVRFSERRWERNIFFRERWQALLVKPALKVTLAREIRRGCHLPTGCTANARSSILGTFPANVRHGYERSHTPFQFPLLIFQRPTKKKVRLFNFLFLNQADTISREYACNLERENRLGIKRSSWNSNRTFYFSIESRSETSVLRRCMVYSFLLELNYQFSQSSTGNKCSWKWFLYHILQVIASQNFKVPSVLSQSILGRSIFE
jgi:hypothetical protein